MKNRTTDVTAESVLDDVLQQFITPTPPVKSISFEERATAALGAFLYDQTLPARLFDLQRLLGTAGVPGHTINQVNDPQEQKIVLRTLIAMVHQYDPFEAKAWIAESFIIEGLLQRDRWRALLGTERDARAFVVMISHHLDQNKRMLGKGRSSLTRGDLLLRRDVTDKLQSTLAGWLGTANKSMVDLRDMTSALFGDAWYMLVVDGYEGDLSIAELIAGTNPPFVPGWLTAQSAQLTLDLPALEC